MKRRDIIKTGSMAGAAIILPASGVFAAEGGLAPHGPVIAALSKYSRKVLPKTTGREVHILASIDRMSRFLDPGDRGKAFPYEQVHAEGNVLSFSHRGVRYKVENVLPEHFDSRAQALS